MAPANEYPGHESQEVVVPHPMSAILWADVDAGRNVVVLRTFSKAYGLAGLRVGWMAATDFPTAFA